MSPPRRSSRDVGQDAILTALDIIVNKVDGMATSVNVTNERMARIETQQTAQTQLLSTMETRVQLLEQKRIDDARIQKLETDSRTMGERLVAIEKSSSLSDSQLETADASIVNITGKLVPVTQFVDRAKFLLPLVTGLGGIAGAIVTAIVLRILKLH